MTNNYVLTTDGELYPYGVKGMKWGVRRGNSAKAYERASKKLRKLDQKADRAVEKAYAKKEKADRKASSFFATEKAARKADFKAQKALRKATVRANKARKWLHEMDSTFKKTLNLCPRSRLNWVKSTLTS